MIWQSQPARSFPILFIKISINGFILHPSINLSIKTVHYFRLYLWNVRFLDKKKRLCHKSPTSNTIRTVTISAPAVQGLLVTKV